MAWTTRGRGDGEFVNPDPMLQAQGAYSCAVEGCCHL
jgi:hypothetical protein